MLKNYIYQEDEKSAAFVKITENRKGGYALTKDASSDKNAVFALSRTANSNTQNVELWDSLEVFLIQHNQDSLTDQID